MKKLIACLAISTLIIACGTSGNIGSKNVKQKVRPDGAFVVGEISTDNTYGLSSKNPVEVGGVDKNEGPLNERRYLNALAGPNGEPISYYRAGSCCPIKSDKDPFGFGSVMLDNYRVTWKGSTDTVSIYINMYDSGVLKAPVGFTIKK